MPLNRAQCLSKLRGAARRVIRAVREIEETPPGLVCLTAHGDLHRAREDLDRAHDALSGITHKGYRRAARQAQKDGTAGSLVTLRRA